MADLVQVMAIVLAGISVGVADALIKKTAKAGGIIPAFSDPWMAAVVLLYLLQIAFFVYVFINDWKLGIVGLMQMVFYAITVLLIGAFYFGEALSPVQIAGIVVALAGVVMMNL
ncbi:Uncharacterised protein [uncultured archaeon]|nr:Uncharacterised protein [uncultured archaeon]